MILFCININDLIKQLRLSTIGCQIQGIYLGIWVYADDIILLSPSRNGLQEMPNIREEFSLNCKQKFSTIANIKNPRLNVLFLINLILIVIMCVGRFITAHL